MSTTGNRQGRQASEIPDDLRGRAGIATDAAQIHQQLQGASEVQADADEPQLGIRPHPSSYPTNVGLRSARQPVPAANSLKPEKSTSHQRAPAMTVQPVIDHGQELARPDGQVIGFVDTKEQFNAVTQALKMAGYAGANITVLQGEDGVDMVERLQETFNFGDGEDAFIASSLKELEAGHYAISIKAEDRDDALRAASLSEPLGAHSFSYFGTWVNERLTR